MAKGYIYIFTNPSFPKYVKIGYAENPYNRLKDANSSTWTPKAFRIYGTYQTDKAYSDKSLHELIDSLAKNLRVSDVLKGGHKRVREFYEMTPEQAWGILDCIAKITNTTGKLWKNETWTAEEILEDAASENENEKNIDKAGKRFDFKKIGILPGDVLKFKYDISISAKVLADSNVEYKGKKYSLSNLAKKLMAERTGKEWKSCQGTAFFTYNGELVKDIKKKSGVKQKKVIYSDVDADKYVKKNAKRFDFEKIGIPVGSILNFKYDKSKQARVLLDSSVEYKEKKYSLSNLAKKLMAERTGKEWKACQGPAFFTYNGKLVKDFKKKSGK